MVTYKIYS